MSRSLTVLFAVLLFSGITTLAKAQVPVVTPAPDLKPALDSDKDDADDEKEIAEKLFTPHWTGAIDASYSSQPGDQGSGQIQKQLGFTGTYLFTEEGTTSVSLGVVGGKQIVEGIDSAYGQFSAAGAVGFGFFQPSLQVVWQGGESGLNSKTSTLDLDFQLWDPFSIGLVEAFGLSNHQGPVSQFFTTLDTTVVIDSGSWTQGITSSFVPWDFLTLTLTAQNQYDDTYKISSLNGKKSITIDQRDTVPSVTLGTNITFLKDFVLGLSLQRGYENYPAGTVYSPITGKTETFSAPTTSYFTGYSFSLTYDLD